MIWLHLGDISCRCVLQRSDADNSSNPDLVERLRSGKPLYKWDRSRFYGPFEDNEMGYTVFPSREYASMTDRLQGQLAG